MATVVVYSKENGVYSFFIGQESIFLRDSIPDVIPLESHAFPPNTSVIDMRKHFRVVAHTLSQKHGFRVQFDTPKQNPETHVGKVRFRMEPKSPKFGIVKGGMEAQDGGLSINTALREFREECMNIQLPTSLFVKAQPYKSKTAPIQPRDVYFLEVTQFKDKLLMTMEAWKQTYYGELFDTQFKTQEEVCTLWKKLNITSKIALEAFFYQNKLSCGGGGSRRKTVHSSKIDIDRRGRRRTKSSR